MEFKLIALILLILVGLGEAWDWENKYDDPVDFECPVNSFLMRIVSRHDNWHEDRQWKYACSYKPYNVKFSGSCRWYNNVNGLNSEMTFRCNGNSVITGVKSTHSDWAEDRIFSFKCCDLSTALEGCHQTDYINGFDGYINYLLHSGSAIVGFYSIHQNHQQDRRWKVNFCDFPDPWG